MSKGSRRESEFATHYSWDGITDQYERLFLSVGAAASK
jgi:hypothetical protein